MSLILFVCIYIFYSVEAFKYYNEINARDAFNFFLQKYEKKYPDKKAERAGLSNFVHNLNEVEALNAKAVDKDKLYILNKFADENPEEYFDKYAVRIEPYDNVKNNTAKSSYLREQNAEKKGIAPLYDLNKSEQLFENYMKMYNKTIPKGKYSRNKKFLRFVKTLVEMNKKNFEGNELQTIHDDADIIKEPNMLVF